MNGVTPEGETLYPNMEADPNQGGRAPIGFEGHEEEKNLMPDDNGGEPEPLQIKFVGIRSPSESDVTDNHKPADIPLVEIKDSKGGPKKPGAGPGNVNVSIPDDEGEDKDNIELLRTRQSNPNEADDSSLFFNDGARRIDFVLVFTHDSDPEEESQKHSRRETFQENLKKDGLEIEISEKEYEKDDKTTYVKIHAPWEVLTRYAEILNMKMPLAKNDMALDDQSLLSKIPLPFHFDEEILPDLPDYFTAPFSRARANQFIIEDKNTFFTPAQRSLLTHQILSRAVFEDVGDKTKNKFGLKKMLSNGSYAAAFPLHEGPSSSEHSILTTGPKNYRHLLYQTWARPQAWYKFQPLDHIRIYFGEKIGIYFAWLGYYTLMLIPAAAVGFLVFLVGCGMLGDNIISNRICDGYEGNLVMCPLCDRRCSYWYLNSSCLYSRVSYLFDNEATVFFALFMALWAVFFHELWKRRAAEIEYDWDVADFEEEETVRPEFEAAVRRRRVNPVNKALGQLAYKAKEDEPYVPSMSKFCRQFSSLWAVIFMLCVVVAAVFGVIVYRMTVSALLFAKGDTSIKKQASTITTVTAALINLVAIIVLGKVYQIIAEFLTNFEMHKTLTEWEDSFTLKMFLFQFVNHFASLFYIAFIKGKFVGRPGDYNRDIGGERQEECDPAGCLIELCIQLGIIMVGKQAFNNFKEIFLPKVMNWFKGRKVKEAEDKHTEKVTCWEKDYIMSSMPDLGLFDEYLEMVLQYGFVTIFVAAFPLAPFFALLNNIIEVRLDAYKFVTQFRRPLAMRAQDIGIWFGILQGVSKMAVISNAVIIAFTSDFIPKLVYRYGMNNDNMDGYLNFTLSTFNVSQFDDDKKPDNPVINTSVCYYRDFREALGTPNEYEYSIDYWHVQTGRLAFIVVFIFAVQSLSWLIMYLVPDVPKSVKMQMLREKYLAREAVMTAENLRHKPNGNA